jgi:flagellar motor protein MotB
MATTQMNDTMASLQDRLVRLHRRLRDQLQKTDGTAQRRALQVEMVEVTHRVQIVGSVLFARQSKGLHESVGAVAKATKELNAAITNIKKLTEFLNTLTAFLGLVDKAIDLAKLGLP